MAKLYFEDFSEGAVAVYGDTLVTADDIKAFAAEFDPQPMHLDEEAARGTMLGGLGASGWHTCAIMMRMLAESFVLDAASMGAPGIDEVKWMKPVRPGDELTIRTTALWQRPSQSKPDRGFVGFQCDVLNGAGETVLSAIWPQMLLRRHPGAAA